MRKIMSLLLALCLIVGMVPLAVSAEEISTNNGSRVVRVSDTATWYSDATSEFDTRDTYWNDVVTAAPEGYLDTGDEVTIDSAEDLVWWAKQVNEGNSFIGKTISIESNIDLSAHYWTPICTGTVSYSGDGKYTITDNNVIDNVIINGNGYTINGLATQTGVRGPNQDSQPGDGNNCYYDAAFIGYSSCDVTVQDLTFEGAHVAITAPFDEVVYKYGSSMVSVLVGAQNGGSLTLNNVTVNNADVLAMQKASAFVGNLMGSSTLKVNNCAITNSRFSAYFQVAPIAGYGETSNQMQVNGIKLENNTVQMVDQSWAEYWKDEKTGAWYYRDNGATNTPYVLNASTTAVFADVRTDSDVQEMSMVASVNGYDYPSLAVAIDAAKTDETVTLLKDTTENVTIASDKDLQFDLNGKTLTLDGTMIVEGDLTVQDSTADPEPVVSDNYETVSYVAGRILYTSGGTAIAPQNGGTFTLQSGIVDASTAGSAIYASGNTKPLSANDDALITSTINIKGGYIHSREYGVGVQGRGATANISGGVIVADDNAAVAGNGTNNADEYLGGTIINITGGTIIGHIETGGYIACGVYHPQKGTLTISGGTIYADEGLGVLMRGGELKMSGGTILANADERITGKVGDSKVLVGGSAVMYDLQSNYYDGKNVDIALQGGNYKSAMNVPTVSVGADQDELASAEERVSITGGYFTTDPSEYVDEDYIATASNKAGYSWMVAKGSIQENVEPAVAEPSVDESDINIDDSLKEAAIDAAESVKANDSLAAAASKEASEINSDTASRLIASAEEDLAPDTGETITLYVQTYLAVTPTEYTSSGTTKTLTLDITPKYRIVASTAESVDKIDLTDGNNKNAEVVQSEQDLPAKSLPSSVEVTVELPDGFSNNGSLYVLHDNRHYHQGTVANNVLTFTTEGFSPFTISTNTEMAAQIGDVYYDSLQAAVDNVKNGETIVLLKDNGAATVSRDVNFTVTIPDGQSYNASISPGTGYRNVGNGNSYDFERIPSTPVNPNPGGSDDKPEEPTFPFTDVKSTSWYYDAVKYVYENNLMAGTGDTTFDPEMNLTRAMTAQILYNLEGKPAVTEEATFTDMNVAPTWSLDAIAWAQDTGVVAGVGNDKFDPNANVTREQFAQMMYNYAKYKGYDLTKAGDLTKFPDEVNISTWAETAMSWANGNGLINGHEDTGLIDPAGTTTRAQAASIIMNFDLNVVK